MIQFLLKKLLRMGVVLMGTTLIMFLLMHAIPGNPWSNYTSMVRLLPMLEGDIPLQQELARRFGLDLPLWRQFTRYVVGDWHDDGSFFCGVVCGNLGPSTQRRGYTVQEVLFAPAAGKAIWESQFGYSIRLVLLAAFIAVGLGLPLGILSAARPKSALSRAIAVGLAGLTAIPSFVLGLLAVIVLASWLKLIKVLPDWQNPGHWIVPALVLAAMPLASIARVTHAALIHVLNEEYVRTARAKGLTENRVLLRHVLRTALVPILTYLGPALMEMFIGLLVVENLYGFPGFGRQFWEAVLALDYPMILGLTLVYATGLLLVNALVELLCEILDPRLRSTPQPGGA